MNQSREFPFPGLSFWGILAKKRDMPEPRRVNTTITLGNGRGKSMNDLSAQMRRIESALEDERYLNIERYTLPNGRSGMAVTPTERNRELFNRAQRAYNEYSWNIASAVNPGRPDYETLWMTEEQRNRRVPRSVYMRTNRR